MQVLLNENIPQTGLKKSKLIKGLKSYRNVGMRVNLNFINYKNIKSLVNLKLTHMVWCGIFLINLEAQFKSITCPRISLDNL